LVVTARFRCLDRFPALIPFQPPLFKPLCQPCDWSDAD
jgi:hypothetical protein